MLLWIQEKSGFKGFVFFRLLIKGRVEFDFVSSPEPRSRSSGAKFHNSYEEGMFYFQYDIATQAHRIVKFNSSLLLQRLENFSTPFTMDYIGKSSYSGEQELMAGDGVNREIL
jgi:hypothetical protein